MSNSPLVAVMDYPVSCTEATAQAIVKTLNEHGFPEGSLTGFFTRDTSLIKYVGDTATIRVGFTESIPTARTAVVQPVLDAFAIAFGGLRDLVNPKAYDLSSS